jgi:hypothetical protein
MSIYDKLAEVLADRTGPSWKVSFSELERLIGVKLPASAFKYPAWWSNNPSNNAMTKIWRKAGWLTGEVDVPGQTLVFRRVERKGAETERGDETGFADGLRAFADGGAPPRRLALEYKAVGFGGQRAAYEKKSAKTGAADWLTDLEEFVARTVSFAPGADPARSVLPAAEWSGMAAGMAAEWDELYGPNGAVRRDVKKKGA